MSLASYIKSKLNKLQLSIDEGELTVMLAEKGADPDGELTSSTLNIAKQIMVSAIPELLLIPDVSQGDYSRKFDRDAVMAYYGWLCDELGIENKLAPQPKVYDASNRW